MDSRLKEARNEYMKEWRKNNPKNVANTNRTFFENKAKVMFNKNEVTDDEIRIARNAYVKEWRLRNKERSDEIQKNYWERKLKGENNETSSEKSKN